MRYSEKLLQAAGMTVVTVDQSEMMGEDLMPSACEVDIMGAVSMFALALASGAPPAILD